MATSTIPKQVTVEEFNSLAKRSFQWTQETNEYIQYRTPLNEVSKSELWFTYYKATKSLVVNLVINGSFVGSNVTIAHW